MPIRTSAPSALTHSCSFVYRQSFGMFMAPPLPTSLVGRLLVEWPFHHPGRHLRAPDVDDNLLADPGQIRGHETEAHALLERGTEPAARDHADLRALVQDRLTVPRHPVPLHGKPGQNPSDPFLLLV